MGFTMNLVQEKVYLYMKVSDSVLGHTIAHYSYTPANSPQVQDFRYMLASIINLYLVLVMKYHMHTCILLTYNYPHASL